MRKGAMPLRSAHPRALVLMKLQRMGGKSLEMIINNLVDKHIIQATGKPLCSSGVSSLLVGLATGGVHTLVLINRIAR